MQQEFKLSDILAFEQRYRATLINSLGGFKSLVLIGTVNPTGKTNLAVFNSLFHLGANPPLFGFIVRPDSSDRHTLSNILSTLEFTVNHVHENFYKQAHQTSARYNASTSEFDSTGLTPEYRGGHTAPFVKESKIQIAADFVRKVDLIENGTSLIIAQIKSISVPQDCLLTDGFVDLEKAGSLTCSGLDSYHSTKKIARLTYAKPNTPLSEIHKPK
ncbi:MAG: flavin reductase [Bacteroidetes bacterium]|nr:flavin reductase [Bacteroidota bacterium]